MAEALAHPPIQQFMYNVHPLGDPLQRFDSQAFNKGLPVMLEVNKYQEAEKATRYTVYESEACSDRYLLVMPVGGYTFIFYIHDDESLISWKSRYGQFGEQLVLKTFLPPAPKPFEGITFTMNVKKAFSSR